MTFLFQNKIPMNINLVLQNFNTNLYVVLGPVVQSIVSLTSSLRGQLVKCFTTLYPNTLKFFVEKMREAFTMQKLLTFFQQKILAYLRY